MTSPKPAADSSVTFHANGDISFDGRDAVLLYRNAALAVALRLYAKSGILMTRGVSARAMLMHATAITGKTYKRGEAAKAAADVQAWVDVAKSSIPVEVR